MIKLIHSWTFVSNKGVRCRIYEPSHEKTNNLGFLPGLTNICLYSPRLQKLDRKSDFTIPVPKRKALISCSVTAQLTCAFGFAYADC